MSVHDKPNTGKVDIKDGLPRTSRYRLKNPVGVVVHDLDVPLRGSQYWKPSRVINMVANGVERGRGKNKWFLPGPLYHFVVFANGRVVQVVDLAWKSNNAGKGDGRLLTNLEKGVNPFTQKMAWQPVNDTANGNPYLVGVGLARMGVMKAPPKMMDALVETIERCFQHYGWNRQDAFRVVGHKEWTHRKVDPRKLDMQELRARLVSRKIGKVNEPPPAQPAPPASATTPQNQLIVLDRLLTSWNRNSTTRLQAGKPTTRAIQRLVGTEDDGLWGPNTKRAVQEWLVKNT